MAMPAWLLLCIMPACLAAWQSVDLGDDSCRNAPTQQAAPALIQHSVKEANVSLGEVGTQDNASSFDQQLHVHLTESEMAYAELAQNNPKCLGDNLQAACKKHELEYMNTLEYLRVESNLTSQPWYGTGEDLVKKMHNEYNQRLGRLRLGWHGDEMVHKDAWDAFESLRTLDARQVLSFRETWTDEDTELLKALDDSPDTFSKGNLTTEKFREYLPSINVLEELVGKGRSVAIVGGGPSMKDHGPDIDRHDVIVRFNHHVGAALDPVSTGRNMTMHVLNWMIDFELEPGVLHMDLESTAPGLSYCRRWNSAAKATSHNWDQVALIMRPSAYCGLRKMWGFTRGFMFYWLVGRLFDQVDLYGMSEKDATWHLGEGTPVQEPFLVFEHLLYATARKIQDDQEKLDHRLHTAIHADSDHRPTASMTEVETTVERHHKRHKFNMYPWPDEA
mmetsp:Transcript_12881/g.29150  ORF Transcript_12881/g.29150 Transcript_12881/m.29150 type:complete len:447 (+) Transcript_12881:47-1387(+)